MHRIYSGRTIILKHSNSGFALAAVLWLLAGLTILAAMISQSNQILAERQAKLKQRADAEQAFLSSRSEALYWLSTSKATESGFGWSGQYLRVDGRGYAGANRSTIQLQDVRGLLNLNRPKRNLLSRLLVSCGADESETDALMDALEDYAEPGKLKRLNGAKDFEYSMAGLPSPRGAPLLSEPEIWRVYGWQKLRSTWNARHCFEDVTVWGDSNFNPGTATAKTLAAYGVTSEQVATIEKERAVGESTTINALQQSNQANNFLGLPDGRYPARTLRVTHSMQDMSWVFRYELKLRSNAEGSPWEISSPRRIPLASVIMPAGRAEWPKIDHISDTDKNAITQPILPF
ncbi:type II secretion system protein GspK [Undibacterium sp. CY21W]|uniref:type II secretion system protein GspK n=1 Tax=Undibacterium sp. CY21W TaxID=2762293 RepID=UPI00164BEAF5|nr:type II secretion system protein GspK [Undibacterium sp. CY21W]